MASRIRKNRTIFPSISEGLDRSRINRYQLKKHDQSDSGSCGAFDPMEEHINLIKESMCLEDNIESGVSHMINVIQTCAWCEGIELFHIFRWHQCWGYQYEIYRIWDVTVPHLKYLVCWMFERFLSSIMISPNLNRNQVPKIDIYLKTSIIRENTKWDWFLLFRMYVEFQVTCYYSSNIPKRRKSCQFIRFLKNNWCWKIK